MKRIAIVCAMAMMSYGLFAQVYPSDAQPPLNTISTQVGVRIDQPTVDYATGFAPEGCIVSTGLQAVMIKDNSTSDLKQDITLTNGAVVSPAGKITFSDGTSMTLRQGECIRMDGGVFHVEPSPVQNK